MAKRGPKLLACQKDTNPYSVVSDFLDLKKSQGVTSFTIRSCRSALHTFLAQYKGNISDGKKLSLAVGIFLAGKSNEYYNKLLQALRQFFDYCISEGILKVNPCDGMRYKRHTTRIVEHSQDAIRALLDIPDKGTFAGLRDYVFILVMLDTGIRPNELLQVRLTDIDFANQQILVREAYSKTKTLRALPLSHRVMQEIRKLIFARHEEWGNEVPVFCTFSGHRMTSGNMQEKFRWYSEKLGVSVTPYHLRHTFALWFVRNGGNLFALQKIMGHAKLDMTRNYVELVQADIKNSHEKASPINTLFAQRHIVTSIKIDRKFKGSKA
jgi:site-specific recombinase XerD